MPQGLYVTNAGKASHTYMRVLFYGMISTLAGSVTPISLNRSKKCW
jgi:hypothetical protein